MTATMASVISPTCASPGFRCSTCAIDRARSKPRPDSILRTDFAIATSSSSRKRSPEKNSCSAAWTLAARSTACSSLQRGTRSGISGSKLWTPSSASRTSVYDLRTFSN